MYTHIRIHSYTSTYVHKDARMRVPFARVCTYMSVCVDQCIETESERDKEGEEICVYSYMCIYICAHMYMYMYTYIYIYIYML